MRDACQDRGVLLFNTQMSQDLVNDVLVFNTCNDFDVSTATVADVYVANRAMKSTDGWPPR
jgi:hypothetical protein